MSDVKKYALGWDPAADRGCGDAAIMENPNGDFVLRADFDAQSLELQAVREALEGLFVACTTDSGAVLIGGAIAKARAALKQSRGAT